MPDPRRIPPHRSIFVRLVAVMVGMAASLLLLVALFFFVVVGPVLSEHHRSTLRELTRLLARDGLAPAEGRRLAAALSMPIRYEGPAGAWTTSAALPTLAEARAATGAHDHVVVPAADGGAYLFAWDFRRPLEEAHTQLVLLLLALIAAVVVVAHAVLSRALRPLRTLQAGVARLGAGDLEVVVEPRARDELGALTCAFNDMVRRVRDMLRARDQLLLDVSHELRSPLTRMKVALALLPADDKTARLVADVDELERMVGGLLELERLRDGGALRRAAVDLAALARQIAAAFADARPGVRVEVAGEPLVVDGDEEKLRAALRNLVENAVKYSLPDSAPVALSLERAGAAVVVRVVDDGPGVPEADLPRLFEPFYRADRSRSRRTGGYGLGLSLCRRIVEAHGGQVVAGNNAGRRGATFSVTLPSPPG